MKHTIMSLILIIAALLSLTACGTSTVTSPDKAPDDTTHSTHSITAAPSEEMLLDFQKYVGEWRTLDNNTVPTISINPDMTMTYSGQTVHLEKVGEAEFAMETPLEVVFSQNSLQTDRFSFSMNEHGLYTLYFSFQRDASISYAQYYFRVDDYQAVELSIDNYTDYLGLEFDTSCQRNPLSRPEVYEAISSIDLNVKCAYIYDLEITYNCNTIYRPVTFEKGRLPSLGEIASATTAVETVKAEHPFSDSSSYAHLRTITLTESSYSTWPENYTENNVCFKESAGIVSISGTAYILP